MDSVVKNFLFDRFHLKDFNVSELSSGMFSKVYAYQQNNRDFVLRLNQDAKDFEKDIYAHYQFGSHLPIPEILEYGKLNEQYFYAIMPRCRGLTHDKLKQHETKFVLPALISLLERIRTVDVSSTEGYGIADTRGVGRYQNWREAMISFYNHKLPQINLNELFDGSMLNRQFFCEQQAQMEELLAYCPERKYLIHGDFGFDNLLIKDNEVTGVIDWAEFGYGDFLYDVAWLDFWSNDFQYANAFKTYYIQNRIDIPHFDKRVHSYQLHIGLHSLIIAAFFNNEDDYCKVLNRFKSR